MQTVRFLFHVILLRNSYWLLAFSCWLLAIGLWQLDNSVRNDLTVSLCIKNMRPTDCSLTFKIVKP
ncbi:hypothetical protein FEM33_04410 [Dyadobacter flavalbus]|uniref:Uncharacterized protein n=1 Tax=Dyadobacter flavalbus TaxID=2579942 RepID=A0A5M8R4I9_9BACT|nr:hypothetical protein FEM33_04410 [Dyadobacter flavalbus]